MSASATRCSASIMSILAICTQRLAPTIGFARYSIVYQYNLTTGPVSRNGVWNARDSAERRIGTASEPRGSRRHERAFQRTFRACTIVTTDSSGPARLSRRRHLDATHRVAWLVLRMTDSHSHSAGHDLQTYRCAPGALWRGYCRRFPKRQLLVVTQTVMLLQASTLALMTALGRENLTAIYLLARCWVARQRSTPDASIVREGTGRAR